MFKNKKNLIKMSAMITSLVFIFNCDDDYIESFNQINPSIIIEANNNVFSNLYWGEEVENIELILKVENSPSISSISTSITYNGLYFDSESVDIESLPNHLFYSSNGVSDFLQTPYVDFSDGLFQISVGFPNSNEEGANNQMTHVDGNGEIARLYLTGKNIQTDFEISIDHILSHGFGYDCGVSTTDPNCLDWTKENLSIGAPRPEIYFDNFTFTNNGTPRLRMSLNISDLPKTTNGEVVIAYDSNKLGFINSPNPSKGALTNSGFELSYELNNEGEIVFAFDQQAGGNNNVSTQGEGSLVFLDFDILNNPDYNLLDLEFSAIFNEAIYDVCDGCSNPSYSEYYNYDVGFWETVIDRTFEWYGCKNSGANNYNENAIVDDGSCEYGAQDPEQVGG